MIETTRKQKSFLRMADRPCGLSYRAACKRGIENFTRLKKQGFLYLQDRNTKLGRYIFRTTLLGKEQLNDK